MNNEIIQITRSYKTFRTNYAGWNAKRRDAGGWSVHFHADGVASTDWIASDDDDFFVKMQNEMNAWKIAMDERK